MESRMILQARAVILSDALHVLGSLVSSLELDLWIEEVDIVHSRSCLVT